MNTELFKKMPERIERDLLEKEFNKCAWSEVIINKTDNSLVGVEKKFKMIHLKNHEAYSDKIVESLVESSIEYGCKCLNKSRTSILYQELFNNPLVKKVGNENEVVSKKLINVKTCAPQ